MNDNDLKAKWIFLFGRPETNKLAQQFKDSFPIKFDGAKLGDDHPDTLESMNDLAILYKEQARYDEAEPLLIQALEGRRIKLGDTHPHTLESISNLIELYEAWNEPVKAKEWRAKLPQTEAVEE